MANPTTVTTLDGSTIPATITGITPNTWTADATGLFTTTTDLRAVWVGAYSAMLAGNADQLTPLQRLEGNAEAVLENTAAAKMSIALQAGFRQDAQREFDAVAAALQIDKTTYGIDPSAEFNADTYLLMEQTLQQNEQLEMLALEGHGLNKPPTPTYDGFTTDYQNKTDGKTFYVGGGTDNGENAIANFFDDIVITHASFPTVLHNGVLTQLNQNGGLEDSLANVVVAANSMMYERVLVASDFSQSATATGATVLVPNVKAAPPLPAPAAPLMGVTALDGTILPETVTGLTAHTWTADGTGLYTTLTDLSSEWKPIYAAMLAGAAGQLTPLQRMEGNAEAVIENTGAARITVSAQAALRQDLQREFDAIDAAMRIDKTTYGIDPNAAFTAFSYQRMEETLQANETLKELGYQGHGVNSPPATKYDGFTTDFQNRIDGTTFYVGGGPGNGELAIANFLDDDVLTHAPFAVVENNGVQTQLNQNGNLESPLLTDALVAANNTAFNRVYVASDFSTDKTAIGAVVGVPAAVVSSFAIAPLAAVQPDSTTGTTAYTFAVTRAGNSSQAVTLTYGVAGSGTNPAPSSAFAATSGTVAFAAGVTSATVTVTVAGAAVGANEGFTTTLLGPLGTTIATPTAGGTIGANTFAIHDNTTNSSTAMGGTVYSGPVANLNWQFIDLSPDNLNISATAPNSFIHTGSGSDAINVSTVGGTNVLDGGTGSNFLVGGTGPASLDTFFVDDRGATADTWSTVANFHAGDAASIFGITPAGNTISWVDGDGAAGYTGLSLHVTGAGQPTASLTLTGFTKADMASGKILTSFGSEYDGTPYLYVYDAK